MNSLIVAKNVKRGHFEMFQHPFCCKISKTLKGDPLETLKSFWKKSHNVEKLKGELFSLVRFCMLRWGGKSGRFFVEKKTGHPDIK